MFGEHPRKPLFTPGVRTLRVIQLSLGIMSVLMLGMGVFALVASGLANPEGRLGFGLWSVLFGTAGLLFAWRGCWRPAESDEEKAREALLVRRTAPFVAGVELLFLSLALLGLLVPERLGVLWRENRSSLLLLGSLAVVDLAYWIGRRRERRRTEGMI